MNNDLLLKNFKPIPTLKVKETTIKKPAFPAIDAHSHFKNPYNTNHINEDNINDMLSVMEKNDVKTVFNLDGGWGDQLKESIDKFQKRYPGKIYTLGNIDLSKIGDPDFNKNTRRLIKEGTRCGMKGIKIYKELGLKIKDINGNLVLPDDPRLRVIWETAAEEGIPVLYHIADPVAFFQPINSKNERYEKMVQRPDWSYCEPGFPTHQQLMECQRRLVRDNPETLFIHPHVLYPENLDYVSELMDTFPNFVVDISAQVKTIGKAPYSARKLFLRHSDRILFGLDGTPRTFFYRLIYRFLETDDEYFDFNPYPPTRWKIYGIHLPKDILKKVYYDNAKRVFKI